uniref:Uncharacterized protein n=1 Tax=Naja naja TaxID=35670 RepID=A0A8C6XCF0_NAJNA
PVYKIKLSHKLNLIQKDTNRVVSYHLFILVLHVLNRDIRQDDKITGMKIKKETYKLRTFVDNLLLYLQDHQNILQHLMKNDFGSLA